MSELSAYNEQKVEYTEYDSAHMIENIRKLEVSEEADEYTLQYVRDRTSKVSEVCRVPMEHTVSISGMSIDLDTGKVLHDIETRLDNFKEKRNIALITDTGTFYRIELYPSKELIRILCGEGEEDIDINIALNVSKNDEPRKYENIINDCIREIRGTDLGKSYGELVTQINDKISEDVSDESSRKEKRDIIESVMVKMGRQKSPLTTYTYDTSVLRLKIDNIAISTLVLSVLSFAVVSILTGISSASLFGAEAGSVRLALFSVVMMLSAVGLYIVPRSRMTRYYHKDKQYRAFLRRTVIFGSVLVSASVLGIGYWFALSPFF